jgi:hypothetical protein
MLCRVGLRFSCSSEGLDLDEGDSGVDSGLEELRNENAPVVAEVLAIDEGAGGEVVVNVVSHGHSGEVHVGLVSSGHEGEVVSEVVVANAIAHGEEGVEDTGDGLSAAGELLDLEVVLAGDGLIGELNEQVVEVDDEVRKVGGQVAELERIGIGGDGVGGVSNCVHELLGLVGLLEASGVGHAALDLLTEVGASDELED